jgi:transcriptional regulator with XRE-family HTH domain
MSQEQLSRQLHVSFATINRWRNGKNKLNRLVKKALYDYSLEHSRSQELIDRILNS